MPSYLYKKIPQTLPATSFLLLGLFSTPLLAQQTAQTEAVPTPSQTPSKTLTTDDNIPASEPKKRKPLQADPTVQQVIIKGGAQTDMDVRRQSTASKIIIGREDLDRDGDSSIGEILKRLPGVTVGGKPGRGGDIRMRGMGSGYTQILVNGERMPRGFSLDTLSPDQVERIEIIRAPVAEYTTQAVAGIINIVLREDYKQKESQLRIAESVEQGRSSPNMSMTIPGQIGDLNYTLSGSFFQNRRRDESVTNNVIDDALAQKMIDQDKTVTNGVHLTPRLEYKLGNGDKLTMQPFLMFANSQTSGTSELSQFNAQTAPYNNAIWHTGVNSVVARLFSNYTHRLEEGAKLEFKFGAGKADSDTTTNRLQTEISGLHDLFTTTDIKDVNYSVGVKYAKILTSGHNLVTGVNADWTRRNEIQNATDNGTPTFDNSGDNLTAKIRQLAGFIQDEWEISPHWSANAGLRWEGIQTSSAQPTGEIVNHSSVWSPLFHVVYRLPDSPKDQIRMSLTHSYRPPTTNNLMAIPSLSQNNSPINPDKIGNPNLKPELANGIDMGYEHYLGRNGILAANLFYRDIKNLIRNQVSLDAGRWVSAPTNLDFARTHGIELEAKFDLSDFFTDAPQISVRSNYSHFWSNVTDIQGPNNRIDQQPSQIANIGADYKMAKLPLTIGGSINWTPAYIIQSSTTKGSTINIKRQLDVYALWKFSVTSQLRFAVNNLVNSNYQTSTFSTLGYPEVSTVTAPTYSTYTLRWEYKY